MGIITLFTYPDYEDEHYDYVIREFSVPRMWLESIIEELTDGEISTVQEFLDEYTWDDSLCVYEEAIKNKVLISDEIVPR